MIVTRNVGARLVAVLALIFALPFSASAHDIPNDVTVQVFVKPDGERLHLLVRAPLRACRDVDFPKRGPGYLDLARADGSLRDAATQWISDAIQIYEGDRALPDPRVVETRVSLESDRSFASYEEALAHVRGARLPDDTEIYWNQGLLDVLFEYPIHSDAADFSIRPGLAQLGLRVVTVVRFLPPGGVVRAFEFTGDPGLVRLDPRWSQAALRFVESGFFHILDGTDHLLFLLCLVIPFRRFRSLVVVVTAFTLAHSITLIASAYNLGPDALWFPPLIETLIAISIVYMALENIVGSGLQHSLRRRWMIAFGFGLVHGFGFSFALRETLQFAGSHLLVSLLAFNVGVELGQLLALALLIPALGLLFRFVVAERIGIIVLSALVAHTGWHWMIERGGQLRQFRRPELNAALLAAAMRWLMLTLILAAFVWLVSRALRRRAQQRDKDKDAARECLEMVNETSLSQSPQRQLGD
ncbi:MAG TPA: HupE/UreJ family protein [Blastocatellia bacterium]|nr:HupE/UreJ family protein [Blastocatellia bacterium]